jgi:hypothetical protein
MTTLLVLCAAALAAEPADKPRLEVRFELAVDKYAGAYPGDRKAALESEVVTGPADGAGEGLLAVLARTFPFVEFTPEAQENRLTIGIRPDIKFPNQETPVRTHYRLELVGPNVRGGRQEFAEWLFRDPNEYQAAVKPADAFRAEIVDRFRGYLERTLTQDQVLEACVSWVKVCPGGLHAATTAEFILPIRCQEHHIDVDRSEFRVDTRVQRPMEANKIERLYLAKGSGRIQGGVHDGSLRAEVAPEHRQEVSQSTVEVLGVYVLRYRPLRDCGVVAPSEFEIP